MKISFIFRHYKFATGSAMYQIQNGNTNQEGVMLETFQRLDKSFFQNSKELGDPINKENLVHKFLPRQTYIDKILDVIQRKVLKDTHLSVEIKEIQVGYI